MTKYEHSFLMMFKMLTLFKLNARQIHILMLRYFAGMKYREIANTLHLSRQRIHQIVQKTQARMRRNKKLIEKIC